MLYKKITGGFLSVLFIALAGGKCKKTDSIILEYRWLQDKPIPIVIFYMDTFSKEKEVEWPPYSYDINSYKVNEECLKLIKKEIKEFDKISRLPDITSVGYYNFIITTELEKARYVVDNKMEAKRLLNRILSVINDDLVKRKVQLIFEDISKRIW